MRKVWIGIAVAALTSAACGDDEPEAPAGAGRSAAGEAGRSGAGHGGRAGGEAGRSSAGRGGAGESGESGEAGTTGESGAAGSAGTSDGGSAGVEDAPGGFAGGAGMDAGAGGQGPDEELEPRPIPVVDESGLPEPVARAGFIEIAPVTYRTYFGGSADPRTSVRARLFYNLLPADDGAKQKPLFVVFNGGPGAATSLLRSYGTGKKTLDPADLPAASVDNPASLTALGNVLYVDSRQAGYSYSLLPDPSTEDARRNASNSQSVNEAFDAADFVRVVLRVLAQEPALKNNPVVLVGESYGGVRAPLMLYLLMNARRLSDSNFGYYDPELGAEALAHFRAVFQLPDGELTERQIAKQFGWQVLLEPLVGANYQLNHSGLMRADARARAALKLGISPEEAEARCVDDMSRTPEECDAVLAAADRVSLDATEFGTFTGVAPAGVANLSASERTGAFRLITAETDPNPDPLGLGALPAWDRYYLPFVQAGSQDQAYSFQSSYVTAAIFVYSVNYAATVVTNARYDMNLLGESIVPALRELVEDFPGMGLAEVGYGGSDPDMPSETIRLELVPGTLFTHSASRLVEFPSFPNSGHFVSVNEPERLYATIAGFLERHGLGSE